MNIIKRKSPFTAKRIHDDLKIKEKQKKIDKLFDEINQITKDININNTKLLNKVNQYLDLCKKKKIYGR